MTNGLVQHITVEESTSYVQTAQTHQCLFLSTSKSGVDLIKQMLAMLVCLPEKSFTMQLIKYIKLSLNTETEVPKLTV